MTTKSTKTRGLRNNNPLNIRRSEQRFVGEVESTDRAFKQFQSIEYGFRAALVIIRTYMTRYGIDTAEGIVARWAPPCENSTFRYQQFVLAEAGIYIRNRQIAFSERELLCRVVAAMAVYECGCRFNIETIYKAYAMLSR